MRRGVMLLALAGCGRIGFTSIDDAGAGDGGDGAVAARCGSPTLIADDFDDGVIGPQWGDTYAVPGTTYSEVGGEIVLTLPATTSGSTYVGYATSRDVDLRDDRVFVEVTQMVETSGHTEVAMIAIGDPMNHVAIVQSNGMLRASHRVSGTYSDILVVPYDPVAHRWWQLREAAGTLYYEVSPDGVVFTPFATLASPTFSNLVKIELHAGTYQPETATGEAHLDNFNGGGPASGQWCSASTLRDDFNAGVLGRPWSRGYGTGCTQSLAAGDAVVTIAATGSNECAFGSATAYDLRGDSIFTALSMPPNLVVGAYAFMSATVGNNDYVAVGETGGRFFCSHRVSGTTTTVHDVPFDPVMQQFWRLGEENGDIVCESSPDGVQWNLEYREPSPVSLSAVDLFLGAGATTTVASPGSAYFSTFNQLPP